MSAAGDNRRIGRDVPLGRGGADRFMPWLIAPLTYLACVALLLSLAATQLADRWDTGLTGRATVELPAEDDPGRRAAAIAAAGAVLTDWPGIAEAVPLPEAEVARLLSPWLGEALLQGDLPLPILIDLRLSAPADGLDAAALTARLRQTVPGAVVDDHGAWRGDLAALAGGVRVAAVALLLVIAGATVAAIVSMTRAGLAIHRPTIELLHTIGATDIFIARQFQRHALGLAARGAALALILVLASVGAVHVRLDGLPDRLLPPLGFGVVEMAVIVLVPLTSIALAALTARWTVLRALARLP